MRRDIAYAQSPRWALLDSYIETLELCGYNPDQVHDWRTRYTGLRPFNLPNAGDYREYVPFQDLWLEVDEAMHALAESLHSQFGLCDDNLYVGFYEVRECRGSIGLFKFSKTIQS